MILFSVFSFFHPFILPFNLTLRDMFVDYYFFLLLLLLLLVVIVDGLRIIARFQWGNREKTSVNHFDSFRVGQWYCIIIYLVLTRLRNSSRVFGSSRKTPNMVDVTVLLFIFWTPRITIHMCLWNKRATKEEEEKKK